MKMMTKMRVLMQSKRHMKVCNGKEKERGARSINSRVWISSHQSSSHLSITSKRVMEFICGCL